LVISIVIVAIFIITVISILTIAVISVAAIVIVIFIRFIFIIIFFIVISVLVIFIFLRILFIYIPNNHLFGFRRFKTKVIDRFHDIYPIIIDIKICTGCIPDMVKFGSFFIGHENVISNNIFTGGFFPIQL